MELNATTTQCLICLEPYILQNLAYILPCLHSYHLQCIEDSLRNCNNECPYCRVKCKATDIKLNQLLNNKILKQKSQEKFLEVLITLGNGQDTIAYKICNMDKLEKIFDHLKTYEQNVEENIQLNIKQIIYSYKDKEIIIKDLDIKDREKILVCDKYRIIQVFVKDFDGQSQLYNIRLNMSLLDFTKDVSKKTNIPIENIRFSCNSKGFSLKQNEMSQKITLEQLGIQSLSNIFLLSRLKGGE